MNALFFICGMVAVAFVLLISIYLIISACRPFWRSGPSTSCSGPLVCLYRRLRHLRHHPHLLRGHGGGHSRGGAHRPDDGLFLSKVAPPKFAAVVHAAVELLAGIPSVVYGLVGMILLVPAIRVAFDLPPAPRSWRLSSCWR